MRKLIVFNSISLDGYFTDEKSDMSFAHNSRPDEEFEKFVQGNSSGGGVLLFGRITYQMMASFWPTPMAAERMPEVAKHMNSLKKVVFSRTLNEASWNNTTLVKTDPAAAVRKMKTEDGPGMAVLGSGTIVKQLTDARLVDVYQVVVVPVVLGKGRTMFDGVKDRLPLTLTESRPFGNGNVVLSYSPATA